MQYRQQGHLVEAEAICRRILQVESNHAETLHLMGLMAHQLGHLDLAIQYLSQAVQAQPDDPQYRCNLGDVLRDQRRFAEAVEQYQQASRLQPDNAAIYNNLGNLLKELGRLDEAIASYQKALWLRLGFAEAYNNLGTAYQAQGRLAEAVEAYRSAVQLKPDYAAAHNNLGIALKAQGRFSEAVGHLRLAVELQPHYPEALNNLGAALSFLGESDEAIACYRRALELKPGDPKIRSSFLCALQYCQDVTPAELLAAHDEYENRHAAPLRASWRIHPQVRDANRPLRLGFVSPNFRHHPVGHFLIRVLENLNPRKAQGADLPAAVVCYHNRIAKDTLTARLQAAATLWRDVADKSDEELAERIRADHIDILFDLAGHTNRNRLLTFARKPAPIQITWMDYEGTTGLKAMDYLLADRYLVPPEAERWYREKVLRMPDSFVCYDPPQPQGRGRKIAPLMQGGAVTFGSFNLLSKITPHVVEIWARILHRVPHARLLLKYLGLDDPATGSNYRQLFTQQGIAPDRVELQGWSPYAEFLQLYQRIDIALDPFPYSGGLTTCEALWMGVPVVTCPGETFASRHGLSLLSTIGLTETIAQDFDDYVKIAVDLANEPSRLATIRSGLRQQVEQSPLCDGKRFAKNLMTLLRQVWRDKVSRDTG